MPKLEIIVQEIIQMAKEDQEARIEYLKNGEQTPERMQEIVTPIDKKNEKRLTEIIDKCGWITISKFGVKASFDAWLIVQHSNFNLQKKCLKLMKECKNDINLQNYAYLLDRVLVQENKPQIYGTQVSIDKETKVPTIFPIEDEKNLDKRRAEIGMSPIKEYLARITKDYS